MNEAAKAAHKIADEWQWGEWIKVLNIKELELLLLNAQSVTDWLRARAVDLEEDEE